ncbi:MAG: ferredoxin, partial [Candidatus Dormibacteraeota bacterium]|nr:ferredoxin [Candidatus Dormibacteraeota bacterium]
AREGAEAGAEAARRSGHQAAVPVVDLGEVEPAPAPPHALWLIPPLAGTGWDTHFVDLQRDVTVADVLRASGAGMRSLEHVKRYTTIGTAHDQGRTSGVPTAGLVAELLGAQVGGLGLTTSRPPVVPVAFAALAGRDRGDLLDPIRRTPIHAGHVALGAVFENVGQWKRPFCYPLHAEGVEDAVTRECRAVRQAVGLMDVSTLGKIEVRGPDAATFLDRVYTGVMSSLEPGGARYGLLCRLDGTLFDDGTVLRLAEDRFFVTTTTGNAAPVFEWLEEWLQTEWTRLRVLLTSVTEQWATIAVAGPRARDVIGRVAPELAAANADFPFMTARDCEVAGLPARIVRISFSGELAYEVSVAGWHGAAVWDALLAAGEPFGITPYGTEAMHVLRAEKGYVIVGQDSDGTTTPLDLGLGWAVSKKKPDFLGKRSLARPDMVRRGRKQLVGLLPLDPEALVPEGAQMIESARPGPPPVPMLGHVTSSYRSQALGRTFALALVRSGRERVGETLQAWSEGVPIAVCVAGSVLFDPENARRDG